MQPEFVDSPETGIEALDEAAAKVNKFQYKVLLRSIETLKKLFHEIERLWKYITELEKRIKELEKGIDNVMEEI